MRKLSLILLAGIVLFTPLFAQYEIAKNVQYRDAGSDDYQNERCVLDVYYPSSIEGFPTIVWFHGGGLKGGKKNLPNELKDQGIAVVSVNYRLSPKVKAPAYIEDAAAAVAWTFKYIADYGGDPDRIYIAGHSAGGYLVSMVGLDRSYLEAHNLDANDLAGVIPFSGQTVTHSTVRKERGVPKTRVVVDDFAPLYHIRSDAPDFLLITGDREKELPGRYEENALFGCMLQESLGRNVELIELDGYNHGTMVKPGYPILVEFIKDREKGN
ncbi:alpha/beta hydrolase [Rubellicoccus peritrichatus]|uniref:Alpha/beta hydrolase n=1 Tax=Rubellicoccus peritrichatus TaxID=3080537 RepID=A0AAQ3LB05_9BACT|nr:alpha/beta hydrolase [Puniceicoccus sp. CR14]WOO42131.1 alpha/beta hydrolase [Puniceicoccus sp. CR14]